MAQSGHYHVAPTSQRNLLTNLWSDLQLSQEEVIISVETLVKYGLGPHLMVDCYGCAKEKLADVDFVLKILQDLPAKIGAAQIAPPQVFKYQGNPAEEWGVSGVVMINKSHISLHTFPDNEHVFIDVFSNEDFDLDYVRDEVVNSFGAKNHKVKVFHHRSDINGHAAGQLAEQPRVVN